MYKKSTIEKIFKVIKEKAKLVQLRIRMKTQGVVVEEIET